MITINKNMKWDSMIPGDWDFMPGLVSVSNASPSSISVYRKAGFIDLSGYDNTYATNFWADNGYGIKGQGAWVLASFTQEEIDYIMNNSNSSYQTSIGTFPIIDKLLVPQISTDVSGVTKFTFADRCVLTPYNITGIGSYSAYAHGISYNWSSTNYADGARSFSGTGKGSKYQIPSTYTGHTSKGNFTHLVYVFGRGFSADIVGADNTAQQTAVMNSGQLYIDTRQFAAFTVGLEGSGADIIMSDTSIIPGKTIFFGNTDDTKIVVSMNTTLTVQ